MFCDESSTEIILSDVTHCDLETKSILKPPKVRAPLQEVDLGNQIEVEFDVIRRRKVSFAGVNKIKEFNSEAKSFSIYNTPVYEEKVSTSSDSSAFSSSTSGTIHVSTKDNDITILDETMDLTDLSLVESQACVPGIFAPKNQDPVFGCPIPDRGSNNPVVHPVCDKLNLNQDPFQIFDGHSADKPANLPPVVDPTKMLINELLEDSVVDLPVDKYLKPSSLFTNNKFPFIPNKCSHNLDESKCISTPGMDLTKSTLHPINEVAFPPNVDEFAKAPAMFDPYRTHLKIMSQNPPNLALAGAQQVCMEEYNSAKGFLSNASQMEFTEAISKPFNKASASNSGGSENPQEQINSYRTSESIMLQNPSDLVGHLHAYEDSKFKKDYENSISQMEFTEALSSQKTKAFQSQHRDARSFDTLRTSQMEFTEALPYKNVPIIPQYAVNNLDVEIDLSKNVHDISLMEFTEALPPTVTSQCVTNGMEKYVYFGKNNFVSIEQSHDPRGSNNGTSMEFGQALPLEKKIPASSENLVPHISSSVSTKDGRNYNLHDDSLHRGERLLTSTENDSQESNGNLNQEKFVSKQPDVESNLMDVSELNHSPSINLEENYLKVNSNNTLSSFRFKNNKLKLRNGNAALQMNLAEEKIDPANIVENKQKMFNSDHPHHILEGVDDHCLKDNLNDSYAMDFTKINNCDESISKRSIQKDKNEVHQLKIHPIFLEDASSFCFSKGNQMSQMEFTEAIPCKNVGNEDRKENLDAIRNNIVLNSNNNAETSKMEFTEALATFGIKESNNRPLNTNSNDSCSVNINDADSNNFYEAENIFVCEQNNENFNILTSETLTKQHDAVFGNFKPYQNKETNRSMVDIAQTNCHQSNNFSSIKHQSSSDVGDNIHTNLVERKSTSPSRGYDNVHMKFTEDLPQCKPESNQSFTNAKSQAIKDNVSIDINDHTIKSKGKGYTADSSHMEFTEALPSQNHFANRANAQHSDADKENLCGQENVHPTKRRSMLAPNENCTVDTSLMVFTEALPQGKSLQPTAYTNSQDDIKENFYNHKYVHTSKRKSIMAQTGNYTDDTSVMEFTEALPQRMPESFQPNAYTNSQEDLQENFYYHKSVVAQPGNHTVNTSLMEFTEALPQRKLESIQPTAYVSIQHNINKNLCNDKNIETCKKKSSISHTESNAIDTSFMEFTEAIPNLRPENFQANAYSKCQIDDKENLFSGKNEHITISTVDDSHVEITEGLPQWNLESAALSMCKENIKENLSDDENVPIIKNKNMVAPSGNHAVDTSQMEFTEALPEFISKNQQFDERMKENVPIDSNLSIIEGKNIPRLTENHIVGNCHMEFAEASQQQNPEPILSNSQSDKYEASQIKITSRDISESDNYSQNEIKMAKSAIAYCGQPIDQSHKHNTELVGQQRAVDNFLVTNNSQLQEVFVDNIPKEFSNYNPRDKSDTKLNICSAKINSERSENKFIEISEIKSSDLLLPIEKLCLKQDPVSKNISQIELNGENIPSVSNNQEMELSLPSADAVERRQLQPKQTVDVILSDRKSDSLAVDNSQRHLNKISEMVSTEKVQYADQAPVKEVFSVGISNQSDVTEAVDLPRVLLQEKNSSDLKKECKALKVAESDATVLSSLKYSNQINQIFLETSVLQKAENQQIFPLSLENKRLNSASESGHISPNMFSVDVARMDVDQSGIPTPDNIIEFKENSEILGAIKSTDVPLPRPEYSNTISENPCDIYVTSIVGHKLSGTNSLLESNSKLEDPELVSICNTERDGFVGKCNETDASLHEQKKNLVHFNTPPVRNMIKRRRKTLGPNESRELVKSRSSNSSRCFYNDCEMEDVSRNLKKKGIFDEEKKSPYDSDKGKEEWERLVKNDSFMKVNKFEFVNPFQWKYKFKWPVELILEIPEAEIDERSRKKSIKLVSKIIQTDVLSMFVDAQVKRSLGVIFSEKWLNSHCKTIRDLLVAIKFVEQEYDRWEPLISSLKYFYREFPFDLRNDRVIFTIVNLRKKYCFEVKIDISSGLVKGKNIDVINHVGHTSKTKVQQLFDQLQPCTEKFFLFWRELKKRNTLA